MRLYIIIVYAWVSLKFHEKIKINAEPMIIMHSVCVFYQLSSFVVDTLNFYFLL